MYLFPQPWFGPTNQSWYNRLQSISRKSLPIAITMVIQCLQGTMRPGAVLQLLINTGWQDPSPDKLLSSILQFWLASRLLTVQNILWTGKGLPISVILGSIVLIQIITVEPLQQLLLQLTLALDSRRPRLSARLPKNGSSIQIKPIDVPCGISRWKRSNRDGSLFIWFCICNDRCFSVIHGPRIISAIEQWHPDYDEFQRSLTLSTNSIFCANHWRDLRYRD